MIGRVLPNRKIMGIYKITNLDNGMCYIGQSVDVADRWRQHVKRGVGAEPVTQNKLYPAMKSIGVENFMFELVEECKGNPKWSTDLCSRYL
jgi:group I intron endonuclease